MIQRPQDEAASSFQSRVNFYIDWLSQRPALAALFLAILSLSLRGLLLLWVPIPAPAIQDEFSYLLAGETFAHGRLTNPTPPLWVHFEAVHEIMHPSYQSKYPPLQGLLLALGQVLLGNPWYGVWLSMAAMTAALYWALAGWLPPKVAFWGGLLVVVQFGFFTSWSEGYMGGAAAAAAGALVVGSVPRLRRKPNFADSITLACGLALLANSRPYEGAALGIACLGAVLIKAPARKIVPALALVLIPAGTWMAYYNYRGTGDPLKLPYQVHAQQYDSSSAFIWEAQSPEPHYNHATLRAVHRSEQAVRNYSRNHPIEVRFDSFLNLTWFFLGWPLAICTAFSFAKIFRTELEMRVLLAILAIFLAAVEVEPVLVAHYLAPAAAVFLVLAIESLRGLRDGSRWSFRCLLVLMAASFVWTELHLGQDRWRRTFLADRNFVLGKLSQPSGKKLVLVTLGPQHDVNYEWIYNEPDLEAAKTVWARSMGAEKDQEVVDYFKDRSIWTLVDNGPRNLRLSQLESPPTVRVSKVASSGVDRPRFSGR